MNDITPSLRQLVAANRILAHEGVVDAFGHVSLRHPENPDRYLLSQSRAPELVAMDDLMEFTLEGDPIDQERRPMYAERPIHGGIYEARPDVQAVVHNHSPALIPFGVTGTPLRPIFHLAAIMGEKVPVWDIRDRFGDTNLLVTTMEQGRDLARCVGRGRAALMRGHGCVVAGGSLKEAVMAAIYLQVNARLLLDSLPLGNVIYLSAGEVERMSETQRLPLSVNRAWEYWSMRAGCEAT
jgi:HCOMODA/2-hydroxy-3-carboxy-muconic semialdehyde decarboxylase